MKVGFIGLGAMGRPMALNLIKGGHALAVWGRRAATVEPLAAAGAQVCASPAAVAAACDAVFTMVTDSADVEAVVLGKDGVAEGARAGALVIDSSTISPSVARRIASELAARNVDLLDAPVSGGPMGAEAGTLSIMVGGKVGAFARAKPLFECLGRTIVHMGESGAGQVTKACNQLSLCVTAQGVAEALALAGRMGVDPVKVREVMLGGIAASRVLELFGKRMADRDFGPGIDSRFYHKDIGIVLGLAHELGAPLPAAALVKQQINALVGAGRGRDDFSALIMVLEKMAQP